MNESFQFTEEEIKELYEARENYMRSMELFEDVNPKRLLNDKQVSRKLYYDQFLIAAILETFLCNPQQNLKDIFTQLFSEKLPKSFYNNLEVIKVKLAIIQLINLKLLELLNSEGNPKFGITEKGLENLRNQTLKNSAISSFYNYKAYLNNRNALILSLLAILLSLVALVIMTQKA